jgi:hypothetical protein
MNRPINEDNRPQKKSLTIFYMTALLFILRLIYNYQPSAMYASVASVLVFFCITSNNIYIAAFTFICGICNLIEEIRQIILLDNKFKNDNGYYINMKFLLMIYAIIVYALILWISILGLIDGYKEEREFWRGKQANKNTEEENNQALNRGYGSMNEQP